MEYILSDISRFTQNLREERRRQGLTQNDLADLSGVSVRFIGSMENGKESCEFGKVLQVASTLGVRIGYSMPGDDS
jgi:y4mF family transcriptional regulator